MLKAEGYRTGIIGKWHLGHVGEHWPMYHGFDDYFGVPYSNNHSPLSFYRNSEKLADPVDQTELTQRFTQEAVSFIEQNSDAPFFMYLSHTASHVPLAPSTNFAGQSKAGAYGDVVEELDWSVGQIIETLKRLEIDSNTLVIFTSDNGPYQGGSAGGLRGTKGTAWEGGLRIPFIARWPDRLEAGGVRTGMSMNIDIMPTVRAVTDSHLPDNLILDGKDIWSMLTETDVSPHNHLFFFADEQIAAVRTPRWKLMLRARYRGVHTWLPEQGINLLFDMQKDPFEPYSYASENPEEWDRLMELWQRGVNELEVLGIHQTNQD